MILHNSVGRRKSDDRAISVDEQRWRMGVVEVNNNTNPR
jgi:hypothetical protein